MQAANRHETDLPRAEALSLTELARIALDDARVFLRAEVALGKAELTDIFKLGGAALVVATASGMLLAHCIAALLAALVLAVRGSAAQALLTAAIAYAAMAGLALVWLTLKLRATRDTAKSAPTSLPEDASEAS